MRVVASNLSKSFGTRLTVRSVSFAAAPGRATMLAGSCGAGKSTVLRMLVGLVAPSSGWARFDGRPYGELVDPVRTVGSMLEPLGGYPGSTGRDHLRGVCVAAGVAQARVDELIDWAGLESVAEQRLRHWPPDRLTRLNLAVALVGDPAVLIIDDVAAGLDDAGVEWLCAELRRLANQGRTVLVSTRTSDLAPRFADDVVTLADGAAVQQRSVANPAEPSRLGGEHR